jgi:hypothetical protein
MWTRKQLEDEILWFEALRDAVEDGDTEDALRSIDGAIAVRRKEIANDGRLDPTNP